MSEIIQKFIDEKKLYRNEGETGVKNLETLIQALGYRKHGFRYGELVEVFLVDNPGAVEALQQWIIDNAGPEWEDRVEMELDEDEDPDYNDEEDEVMYDDPELAQKHAGGTLEERYEVYRSQAESLGWDVMTFDEWLNR